MDFVGWNGEARLLHKPGKKPHVRTGCETYTDFVPTPSKNTFYLVAAAFNIALDIAIVLIPIPELIKLKLSSRKKLLLGAIFGVGAV